MRQEGSASGIRWRWVEADPWGRPIHCAEETWATKLHTQRRTELATHEEAIRATVRDPDELYDDPASTARIRAAPRGNPAAAIVHYVARGRAHGKQAGNLIDVVVKLLPDPVTGQEEGFVQTIILPDALRHRLQLRWGRP